VSSIVVLEDIELIPVLKFEPFRFATEGRSSPSGVYEAIGLAGHQLRAGSSNQLNSEPRMDGLEDAAISSLFAQPAIMHFTGQADPGEAAA
jgi:hypothetical protein